MSICEVNAHHQNCKAERRIGDATTGAGTVLLHTTHRWPNTIHWSWPSILKNHTNLHNDIPTNFIKGNTLGRRRLLDQFTPPSLSRLSGIGVKPNFKDFHSFSFPVHFLKSNFQTRQSQNKWSDSSRVSIFSVTLQVIQLIFI